MVRPQRNVEVDGDFSGRVTKAFPVLRDVIPSVFDTYVIPKLCERHREVV